MNTPILMQSEEKRAPWNNKIITVNVHQLLSTTVEIEVPGDFEDYDDSTKLQDFVREQIILPSELLLKHSSDCWNVEELCVEV